jgi:hypothetical protein
MWMFKPVKSSFETALPKKLFFDQHSLFESQMPWTTSCLNSKLSFTFNTVQPSFGCIYKNTPCHSKSLDSTNFLSGNEPYERVAPLVF